MAAFVKIILNHWQLNVGQHNDVGFSEQTGYRIAHPREGKSGIKYGCAKESGLQKD